jgi:23S rRNA pseudouridine955/2504/2580 synthase
VTKASVQFRSISDEESGQRVDNFLLRTLNGVPKTRIYKAIRKGEVRVNKGRVKPETKLAAGDLLRIPPLDVAESNAATVVPDRWFKRIAQSVVYEDRNLIVLNKPTGLAVHGGSGVNFGLIESLRQIYPNQRYLELVHRLDRDTSGLIMVAKRAATLRELHQLLRGDGVDKRYLALVHGKWPAHRVRVEASLEKSGLSSGERVVRVSVDGRRSITDFRVLERLNGATLIEAKPVTGRTHQIRVHAQHAGHPIMSDPKYANEDQLNEAKSMGLKRLFLHAHRLSFKLDGKQYDFEAPMDAELRQVCDSIALPQ